MFLKEFDLNKHIESEKEISYADGLVEGRLEGRTEGEEFQHRRFSELFQRLSSDSRTDDIAKAAADIEYCKTLYKE